MARHCMPRVEFCFNDKDEINKVVVNGEEFMRRGDIVVSESVDEISLNAQLNAAGIRSITIGNYRYLREDLFGTLAVDHEPPYKFTGFDGDPKAGVEVEGRRYLCIEKFTDNRDPKCSDPHVEANVAELRQRSAAGLKKYGVDLTRSDLSHAQWLQHFIEELLDAANYARVLLDRQKGVDAFGQPGEPVFFHGTVEELLSGKGGEYRVDPAHSAREHTRRQKTLGDMTPDRLQTIEVIAEIKKALHYFQFPHLGNSVDVLDTLVRNIERQYKDDRDAALSKPERKLVGYRWRHKRSDSWTAFMFREEELLGDPAHRERVKNANVPKPHADTIVEELWA